MIQCRIYGLESDITRYAQLATYFTKMSQNVTISGVAFWKSKQTKNGDFCNALWFVDQTSKLKWRNRSKAAVIVFKKAIAPTNGGVLIDSWKMC